VPHAGTHRELTVSYHWQSLTNKASPQDRSEQILPRVVAARHGARRLSSAEAVDLLRANIVRSVDV
jgi:hypothetical protein